MKVIIDDNSCIGCGKCVEVCSEVFSMITDDTAAVTADPVPAEHEEACREAFSQCPVEAIAIC